MKVCVWCVLVYIYMCVSVCVCAHFRVQLNWTECRDIESTIWYGIEGIGGASVSNDHHYLSLKNPSIFIISLSDGNFKNPTLSPSCLSSLFIPSSQRGRGGWVGGDGRGDGARRDPLSPRPARRCRGRLNPRQRQHPNVVVSQRGGGVLSSPLSLWITAQRRALTWGER